MADNYLEKRMRDYEERKAMLAARKGRAKAPPVRHIQRPEDEAL